MTYGKILRLFQPLGSGYSIAFEIHMRGYEKIN